MAVIVERTLRHRKVGDVSSPKLNYLKRKARTSRLYDIKRLSQEIEEMGGMSAEDVEHVMKAIVRNLKRKLTDEDSVKLDGFGVFYTTFHSVGTEKAEDCVVKNIDKVNIRFLTDSSLRLVNEANATTRSAPNNITFQLYSPKDEDGSPVATPAVVIPAATAGLKMIRWDRIQSRRLWKLKIKELKVAQPAYHLSLIANH